jgi:hypothetical protein
MINTAERGRLLSLREEARSGHRFAMRQSGDILDYGSEHIIVPLVGRPDKVIGVRYLDQIDDRKAKDIFHAHKIFSTLFPHNFPHISASSGVPSRIMGTAQADTFFSATIRERVQSPVRNHDNPLYPIGKVEEFFADMDMQPRNVFDWVGRNLMDGIDGGTYYVDISDRPAYLRRLRSRSLWRWMDTHTVFDKKTHEERVYTDAEKATIDYSIDSIEERAYRAKQ